MRRYVLIALLLFAPACAKTPPNLSPQATLAWNQTEVIKDLDILRDVAYAGSKTTPPVVTPQAALKVVNWHTGAIKIVHDASAGWQTDVQTGLDELLKNLVPSDQAKFGPYVALIKAVLKEVS